MIYSFGRIVAIAPQPGLFTPTDQVLQALSPVEFTTLNTCSLALNIRC